MKVIVRDLRQLESWLEKLNVRRCSIPTCRASPAMSGDQCEIYLFWAQLMVPYQRKNAKSPSGEDMALTGQTDA